MDCGYGAYVDLMKRYPLVTQAFLQLKPGYQKVLLNICSRIHSICAQACPLDDMHPYLHSQVLHPILKEEVVRLACIDAECAIWDFAGHC